MVSRFLSAVFALCIGLITFIATPAESDACGGVQRRQARRQARFEARQARYEPAEQVQFEYRAVVPVQSVAIAAPKVAETPAKVQCSNPDCKCGPDCSCADFALKNFKAGQQQGVVQFSAPSGPMYHSGYETVCENGFCFRRPVFSRFRR